MGVDYTIVSRPCYVRFECPYCGVNVDIPFELVDFKTDYWGDGAWTECSHCEREVELDNGEYD